MSLEELANDGLARSLGGAPKGNTNGLKWSPEQDDLLKKLYAEQLSCSAISKQIVGKSRNAVIGRIHRMGLTGREPVQRPSRNATRRVSGRKPGGLTSVTLRRAKIDMPELRCDAVEPLHIGLGDLTEDNCHWPYGDGPFTFCGHVKFQGSYCAPHYFLSIGPGTPGERAAARVPRRILEGAR